MLALPNADIAERFSATRQRPAVISKPPCSITMDRSSLQGSIYISRREIVGSVERVLVGCRGWGLGGWEVLEGYPGWILTVDGESAYRVGGGSGE